MLKRNLFFLFTITLFATASLVLDIFNYNPYQASSAVFVNFYVSLFLSLGGVGAFFIYYLKIKSSKDKLIYAYFWPSVRQGASFAAILSLLLFLHSMKILDWWVGTSAVVVAVLLELFFQTKRPSEKKMEQEH
jgi:hypothetical protein